MMRRFAVALLAVLLATSGLTAGAVAVHQAAFPPERLVWFDRLLDLAQKADAAYDELHVDWSKVGPRTWPEFFNLEKEIIYQISEEGASYQLVQPAIYGFVDFGPGRRSGVAGMYLPNYGAIFLNERFLWPAWGDQNWLEVLIHETVHAQGYFVGDSATLEAQTEIVATEVLAAMANLGYPGAQADLLDGLRRDALGMAYYIARFGGGPLHSTHGSLGGISMKADPALMARWQAVREQVFTPTELARSDKRIRWWNETPLDYAVVLGKYVVTTTTMELDAACGSGIMAEAFQQFKFLGLDGGWTVDKTTNKWVKGDPRMHWGYPYTLSPLVVDDLVYVLRSELHYCGG